MTNPISWALSLALMCLLFPVGSAAGAQKATDDRTSIEGQLVCSECWFEADRKTTAYGDAADLDCARECSLKGIPPAVAVKEGADYKLYLVEAGKFKQDSAEWLKSIGKWVKVSGRLRKQNDKAYVAVDEFQVVRGSDISAQNETAVGSEAELMLKDLFGVEQKLSSYRGKIVLLNFWATWCVPCRKEMPDLAVIQNEYAPLGVQVVGAAADTMADRATVLQFIKTVRVNFPVWLGVTSDDMKRFGLGGALPGTVIIGRNGKILSVTARPVTERELRRQLDALLGADTVALKIEPPKKTGTQVSLVPS